MRPRSFSSLLPVHQNPRRRCIRQVRTTRGPGSSTCSGASVDLSYGDSVRASMAFGVPPVPPALSPPRVRRGPRAGHGNQAWLYVSCRVVWSRRDPLCLPHSVSRPRGVSAQHRASLHSYTTRPHKDNFGLAF